MTAVDACDVYPCFAANLPHLSSLRGQLAQCLMVASADGATSPLECVSAHYRAEAMASWRAVVKWNAERELSTFHKNVTSTLHQLDVEYEDKHVSSDGCVCLDIFCPLPPGSPESKEFKG